MTGTPSNHATMPFIGLSSQGFLLRGERRDDGQGSLSGLKQSEARVKCGAAIPKEPSVANPVQFINQVRAELGKITWPTRREVVTTTIMVFIFAALASLFFSLVDLAIRFGLTEGLKLISA